MSRYTTANPTTIRRESLKLPTSPNTLLNLSMEKIEDKITAPVKATMPLSRGLNLHDSLPDITTSKSHNTSPAPATKVRSICLFSSKKLDVHGKKNRGIRKTPTNRTHLAAFL